MELLTIGAFARAAGLTPKALRLYDDVGLLTPAAVDPESAYRLYDPDQLGRARLIGELRRVGMPLAEIRTVCDLQPQEAAKAVRAYGDQIAADVAARTRLVALLVEQISGRSTTMSDTVTVRYAARRDNGTGRDTNEDFAYAGDHLFAVADGMRGEAGSAAAAAAVEALKQITPGDGPAVELLTGLAAAVADVDRAIRDRDAGAGTTLTALVRRGTQLALVHVGDTRVYLLRGGELSQLTQDHTWVQSQVDHGKLSPGEVAGHPQRAMLTRAVGAGPQPVEADLALRTASAGDRYLLCSDGLSAVVGRDALRDTLVAASDPDDAVERLVALAYEAGAPDNIACVVADILRS
jgi:PPM family protein phosphatase